MKLTNVTGAVLGAMLLTPQAGYCQKLIAAGTLDASGSDRGGLPDALREGVR